MQPLWPLTLYYDGDCPLCAREIDWLRRRADSAKLQLADIRASDFDSKALGYSMAQLQNLLHARFADGQWVTGLDATYWSWTAAGHIWLARPLAWRSLRPALDGLYQLFCRLRPGLAAPPKRRPTLPRRWMQHRQKADRNYTKIKYTYKYI